jgi:hypothetical protein
MQALFLKSRLLAGVHHVQDEHVKTNNGLKGLAEIAGANGLPPVLLSPRSNLISKTSGRTRVSSPERPRVSAAPRVEP